MSSLTARLRTERTTPRRQAPTRRRLVSRRKTRLPRWIWTLGAAALLVVIAIAFTTTFLELYRLQREADRLVRMRTVLRQESAALRGEIHALHTPEYIERIAREELGLVKPGEIALLIVTPPAKPPAPPARPREEASWLSQGLRWLARLFTGSRQ